MDTGESNDVDNFEIGQKVLFWGKTFRISEIIIDEYEVHKDQRGVYYHTEEYDSDNYIQDDENELFLDSRNFLRIVCIKVVPLH